MFVFLLLWYHYRLHQLGLFSYGLYVISCIRERVLFVFVQDCQNGSEFARYHLMYSRSCFAFDNNNNYHPIPSSSSQSSSINPFLSTHPLGIALLATYFSGSHLFGLVESCFPLWPGGDSTGKVDKVYR